MQQKEESTIQQLSLLQFPLRSTGDPFMAPKQHMALKIQASDLTVNRVIFKLKHQSKSLLNNNQLKLMVSFLLFVLDIFVQEERWGHWSNRKCLQYIAADKIDHFDGEKDIYRGWDWGYFHMVYFRNWERFLWKHYFTFNDIDVWINFSQKLAKIFIAYVRVIGNEIGKQWYQ